MCRWIAYRGKSVALENFVTAPTHSLMEQSLNAREAVARTNGDGFGFGWYGSHEAPGLYHEVRPAWSDENLRHLCRNIESRLFFAHVRASTGTPTTRPNCHPFSHGRWLFMHNGQIGDWKKIRRQVENLIPDSIYEQRVGTTDSEATFLAIAGAGLGNSLDEDPVAATDSTIRVLATMVDASRSTEPLRFTAALTDGHNLYAFRYASDQSANTLYYREQDGDLLVASEPLDPDQAGWNTVPPNSVLIAPAGERARIAPFLAD